MKSRSLVIVMVFWGLGIAGCGATGSYEQQAQLLLQMEGQRKQTQMQQHLLTQVNQASPVDYRDYRVGSEDLLEVQVFGHDNLNRLVRVNGQGAISLPLVGEIMIAGRPTASQLGLFLNGRSRPAAGRCGRHSGYGRQGSCCRFVL